MDNNPWIAKLYKDHRKWAKTFLRVYPFVNKFEMVISKLRQKELVEEYLTSQMTPILTTHLKELEAHASKLFTRNIFSKVQREILIEAILPIHDVVETDDMKFYTITQYLHEGRLLKVDFHMSKSVYDVVAKKLRPMRSHNFEIFQDVS
ncbi:hypothetical protein M9H77_17399 [Catharanthus roseus]|uniref:Uncharacterized protein n=1 Tax=Catharanthus roseus TaxID=4058 RepID=A0ACC0B4G4_CATRO|nr:hypothetical protein M9H77_17399 [Catharanthus roseus]